MTERPILFSAPLVRAILDGKKTQTRRVVTPQPILAKDGYYQWIVKPAFPMGMHQWGDEQEMRNFAPQVCPKGQVGDQLWVREAWRPEELESNCKDGIRFRADDAFQVIENTMDAAHQWLEVYCRSNCHGGEHICNILRWRPSIHMPRWASRIDLTVTGVRIERLHEISEGDAKAEGMDRCRDDQSYVELLNGPCRAQFATLWDTINAKRGFEWKSNPWVWALDFGRIAS